MKKRIANILYVLLFSILGLLAYVLLSNAANLPSDAKLLYKFAWGYIFFIVSFNILGFLIIRLSRWIGRYVMQQWKMILLYSCVAVVLLFFNYGLLLFAKILVGVDDPFSFPNGGGRVLIILWLLQLIIVGMLVINQTVMQNMSIQKESARLQDENNKAKYAALQGQLNPHFLFNNLNTLIAEIEYDPSNAVCFTRNLSDAYRYVLQCQDKTLVTIKEELVFMNSYIFLHKVRIGNYIDVQCELPDNYSDAKIPPLTLQLLIENVIKHNVISENYPMIIKISISDDKLIVSNTLNPRKQADTTEAGLKNLSNRCLLMTGNDISVEKNNELFTVKVPIKYE